MDDGIQILVALAAIEIVGAWFTVTTCEAVFTQPFTSVPVTVYVFDTVGTKLTPLLIPFVHE